MLLSTSSSTNDFQRKHKTRFSALFIWTGVKHTSHISQKLSLHFLVSGKNDRSLFTAFLLKLCHCAEKNKTEGAREGEESKQLGMYLTAPQYTALPRKSVHVLLLYFIHGFFNAKMHKEPLGQGAEPMGGTTSDH